jgi:2-keto-4-pentenoate hydratase/2-oxohepta-3-ene-1,7-dioic acid hydratase in catechol pathway
MAALVARALLDGTETYGEVAGEQFTPHAGEIGSLDGAGDPVPLADVKLLAPTEPRALLVTMGGFLPPDVTSMPPEARPWLVPKMPTSISGEGGVVVVPPFVSVVWVEVEVAIVIGKTVHNAGLDEAREAIFGYTVFHDASAPQFLFADVATYAPATEFDIWRAKSMDTFASMGPWIRTDLTEKDIADGLQLTARINGEVRSEGNTRNQKFAMSTWVSHASQHATLQPGDVISLGTPAPAAAQPGDELELEVEGIGVLHNTLVAG